MLAYLLSKSINKQGGFFRLLHEKLRAGRKENLKNVSEYALLLGTSEYLCGRRNSFLYGVYQRTVLHILHILECVCV